MERIDSMDYLEKAAKFHDAGCNCCQAVIMCCAERYGLTEEQAYRLGAFFGGGMRCGEVCGAVSGMMMVYGLIDLAFAAVMYVVTAMIMERKLSV